MDIRYIIVIITKVMILRWIMTFIKNRVFKEFQPRFELQKNRNWRDKRKDPWISNSLITIKGIFVVESTYYRRNIWYDELSNPKIVMFSINYFITRHTRRIWSEVSFLRPYGSGEIKNIFYRVVNLMKVRELHIVQPPYL